MKTTSAHVQSLFVKRERKAEMSTVSCLNLHKGFGIEGNINSDEISPRQILVVCGADLERFSIEPGKLRENIVLEMVNSQVFKPGAKLSFASGAEIRLTFYCEPCQRMSHLVDSIASLAQKRGILGIVTAGGAIALKDKVVIEPDYYPALSEIPYERFLNYVEQIPVGKVVTYKQILKCIGVDRSYFRAIPIYLKKAPANYPLHRVVDSQGRITSHIIRQSELLEQEGVKVDRHPSKSNKMPAVSLSKYGWHHGAIY